MTVSKTSAETQTDGADPVDPRLRSIRGGTAAVKTGTGLTRKLFLKILPIVAIFVLVTQVVIAFINYDGQLRVQGARAQLIVTLTADAVAGPVWDMDQSIYVPQINALEHDEDFRAAVLTDESGSVLYHIGEPSLADTTNKIVVSAPLISAANKTPIGKLTLTMSSDSLRQSAWHQVYIALIAFIVLMLGLILALNRSVYVFVQQPLDRILNAMHDVEHKQWTTVSVHDDGDEIGSVAKAFNRMVEGLKSGDEAKRLLAELEVTHRQLGNANRLILDSIDYASRIQNALLPDPSALGDGVAAIETIWQPLHLVGGDYYWLERFGERSGIIVTDCTGHGVPGAFMTMIAASAMAEILHRCDWSGPADILRMLDGMVRVRLHQDRAENDRAETSDDGLDAAVCIYDPVEGTVTYAGANIPLLSRRNGIIEEVKPVRTGLGYRNITRAGNLVDHTLKVEPGDVFYLFTDGVQDHMGGQPRRLFGRRRLAAMLAERPQDEDLGEQLQVLKGNLDAYRGENTRRDDMTMIAFRPR